MNKLLLFIAIFPAAFLMRKVYDRDRLDKEPSSLLTKLVFFGTLSCLPAGILEAIAEVFLSEEMSLLPRLLIENFLIVALAEEGCKYLMLRRFTWKSKEFNCSFDGLIYAVFVSMGFALLENVFYVAESGLGTGLFRAVTAIPGHCFFAVFMGVQYGEAKAADYRNDGAARRKYLRGALFYAVLAHGAYDFLIDLSPVVTTIPFLLLLVILYIKGARLIRQTSEQDRYIMPQ